MKSGRGIYSLGLILSFALLFLRSWNRIKGADIWAEDGVFLSDLLNHGWAGIFIPLDGYYQPLQRGLAAAALLFSPLPMLAQVISILSVALGACVWAQIASDRYRWLLPSDGVRLSAAAVLCFIPSLDHVLGSLCNTYVFLIVSCLFVSLRDPRWPLRAGHVLWVLVAGISFGAPIVVTPAFLMRAWWRKNYTGRWPGGELWIVLLFCISSGFVALKKGGLDERVSIEILPWIMRLAKDYLFSQVLMTTLLSFPIKFALEDILGTLLYPMMLPVGVILWWKFRSRKTYWSEHIEKMPATKGQALAAILMCILFLGAAMMLARHGAYEFMATRGFTFYRYAVAPHAAGVVFWLALYHTQNIQRFSRAAFFSWLLIGAHLFVGVKHYTKIAAHSTSPQWTVGSRQLEEALRMRKPVEISIPPNRKITVTGAPGLRPLRP